MADQIYEDSNYRFTDPIRFFKANDPYYFEVDNIPLKQLQENCMWLKDQVRNDSRKLLGVKRGDLDELRPFATGGDRMLRVKPGRYTARINDASTKTPLSYLNQVMGSLVGEVDAWNTALPNPGTLPDNANAVLEAALETFKQAVAQEAMGMTGLVERAFTWPIVNSDGPVNHDGVVVSGQGYTSKVGPGGGTGGGDLVTFGAGAIYSPKVISQALVWAKSFDGAADSYILPTFETTNPNSGWAKFPRTESYFIKRWRGISRLAIVDVDDEISIEVPRFDPDDFAYTNSTGATTRVTGVQSRIDLVFIYSKPVDSSGINIVKPSGNVGITKPTLGIVRGAGIKTNFKESSSFAREYLTDLNDDHGILAHPGDQLNANMGFTATSSNDIDFDVRGSFPAPDDILNLAPLISEKLESNALELVGQSILPVAYVWVQSGSQVVLSTDVIDIRPMFRTAELAYNERAGIGAAFPQLSLANPAVGRGQLDYEIKRSHDNLNGKIEVLDSKIGVGCPMGVVATGYVFGGWNFGPEGALWNFWDNQYADQGGAGDYEVLVKAYIVDRYAYSPIAGQVTIPDYPDWDLSQWATEQSVTEPGLWPNDYLNTYISETNAGSIPDASIVGGSFKQKTLSDGTTDGTNRPSRLFNTWNFDVGPGSYPNFNSRVNFMYVSKKIKFIRPASLADYEVDVELLNCIPANFRGSAWPQMAGSYHGIWVEKGYDEFTIYVSCVADTNNYHKNGVPKYPAPEVVGGVTISQRGGEQFSAFAVPVGDLLYSNTTPIANGEGKGYVGNPRIGKCTYPTITWSMTGIPMSDAAYHYGNLNSLDPVINIKE